MKLAEKLEWLPIELKLGDKKERSHPIKKVIRIGPKRKRKVTPEETPYGPKESNVLIVVRFGCHLQQQRFNSKALGIARSSHSTKVRSAVACLMESLEMGAFLSHNRQRPAAESASRAMDFWVERCAKRSPILPNPEPVQ